IVLTATTAGDDISIAGIRASQIFGTATSASAGYAYFNATADADPTLIEVLTALEAAIDADSQYEATFDVDAVRANGVLTIANKTESTFAAQLTQGTTGAPAASVTAATQVVSLGAPTADQVFTLILKETTAGTVRAFAYHAD